ncbi:MAG TPA: TrkA C-terminal domain-containing protein, partial [Candidatus Limnocylindrales bacterium]
VRFEPPASWVGRALRDLELATRYQLSSIGLRRGPKVIVNPHRDEKIAAGDELVLMGLDDNLAKLEQA